jgi:YVTN family beta-propeller protein
MGVEPAGWLGVDFGTSNTAASVISGFDEAQLLPYRNSTVMPSAVFVETPSVIHVGEPALERGAGDPDRLIAAPKRWIAARHPVLHVCGEALAPEHVVTAILHETVSRAHDLGGDELPAGIALTHPESWQPRQVQVLTAAAAAIGYPPNRIRTIPESHAAAHCYQQTSPMPPGDHLAVVDWGAAGLTVTVLTATDEGTFRTVATDSETALGGDSIDAGIRAWVDAQLAQHNPALPARLGGVSPEGYALDRSIRSAKEQLTLSRSAVVEIRVDGGQSVLTLTRKRFEELLAPVVARAEELVLDVIDEADVGGPERLHGVYLLGGCSRVPLLRRTLSALGPVVIGDALDTVNARGALGAHTTTPLPSWLVGPQLPDRRAAAKPATPRRKRRTPPAHALLPQATAGGSLDATWLETTPLDTALSSRARAAVASAAAVVLAFGVAAAGFVALGSHAVAGTAVPLLSATIHLGHSPRAMAVDAYRHAGYVANSDGTLSVIDLANKTLVATVAVGLAPRAVAIDPLIDAVYVVNGGSSAGDTGPHGDDGSISVVNTGSHTVVDTIPTGRNSAEIAIDPVDHTVYVVNYSVTDGVGAKCGYCQQSSMSVIDGMSHSIVTSMPIGEHAGRIAIDPDTRTAYVTNNGNNSVSRVDTATNTRIAAVHNGGNFDLGKPSDVAVDPQTHSVYVTSDHGTVVVNTATNALEATIDTGPGSHDIALDPARHLAYVDDPARGVLMEIDTVGKTVRTTLPIGPVDGVAVDSSTHGVYLLTGDGVEILGAR